MNKVRFVPRWQGAIEGHAVNVVRRHFAMLCAEHEFDDLLQEAYLVYMRVKASYPAIDKPAWFMSVFSVSLRNHLLNMAAKCGRTVSLEDVPLGDLLEPQTADLGFSSMVLQELPEAVKHLIHAVCFGPGAEGRRAFRKLEQVLPSLT